MISTASAQTASDKIGQVSFPVSCSPAVQKPFERGVALLHSFWYLESVKAFTAVTQADPDCAMGYWGIAMSLWYQIWSPPSPANLKRGWEAVEKAKAAPTKTQRERDWVAAAEAFYKDGDKLDHRTRALAYEKAMEQVYARYPQDREAMAFYALALQATAEPHDKTYAKQKKSAELAEKVLAAEPDHPGAAHYIIHGYDYPTLAQRGLDAARRYDKFAPAVPHALHMPSHIYVLLGMWPETIQGNITAAAAEKTPRQSGRPHARARLPGLRVPAAGAGRGGQEGARRGRAPSWPTSRRGRSSPAVPPRTSPSRRWRRAGRWSAGSGRRRRASSRARTASPTPSR